MTPILQLEVNQGWMSCISLAFLPFLFRGVGGGHLDEANLSPMLQGQKNG
jgi:hypothetical protein